MEHRVSALSNGIYASVSGNILTNLSRLFCTSSSAKEDIALGVAFTLTDNVLR